MIISTTDPISLTEVQNPESHPFVVEGDGENALKIYFENEENKSIYLGIDAEHQEEDFEPKPDNSV
ncbi:MAG: hypothetical protein P8Y28_03825 [Gammaproteobacteria bacterium]|jgi:hypothetical protein